jgi:hypothetical protein
MQKKKKRGVKTKTYQKRRPGLEHESTLKALMNLLLAWQLALKKHLG